MSEFPLLNLYRILAMIFAAILLVIGVVVSWGAATLNQAFNLQTMVVTLLPFLGGAFTLGVVAELILMALKIEDHLDDVIEATKQTAANTAAMLEHTSVTAAAATAAATAAPATAARSYNAPPPKPAPVADTGVQVQARMPVVLRSKPDANVPSAGELGVGQTIHVYGRNADTTWLTLSTAGRTWLNAAEVAVVAGILANLPVIESK